MGTIIDALAWSGSGACLSLFAVFDSPPPVSPFASVNSTEMSVRTYILDDDDTFLHGRVTIEYDFSRPTLPVTLQQLLEALLQRARAAGAIVAWFGFEGSFNFEHLLTGDIANLIYAIADEEGTAVATDGDLPTADWCARVTRAGQRARSPSLKR